MIIYRNGHYYDTDKMRKEGKGGIYQEVDPTVPSWAKQDTKPSYTPQEIGALPANSPLFDGMKEGESIAEYVHRVAITIDNVPENLIGTEHIENGAVHLEDLNEEVKNKIESNYYDDDESLWIEGKREEEYNGENA